MNLDWLKDCAPLAVADSAAWGTGRTVTALLAKDSLLPAAQALKDRGFFLEFMTALDVREGFLLTYLFSSWKEQNRIVLRVQLPAENPEVPSLSAIHSGADWHERECRDFYGVLFTDHPNMDPLLLPADMELRPLRKKPDQRRAASALLPLIQLMPSSRKVQDQYFKPVVQGAPNVPDVPDTTQNQAIR